MYAVVSVVIIDIIYMDMHCYLFIYRGLPSSCQMLVLSSILSDQVLKFADSIEPAPVIHKVSDY